MKFLITAALVTILGIIILIPHSEVHDAKVSKFVEDSSTFTAQKILEDPELAMHSIRKDIEQKLKQSSEHVYSLSKQKNKLQISIRSSYNQADRLRDLGNKAYMEWKALTLEYKPVESEFNDLVILIEELKNSQDPNSKSVLKKKQRELRELTRTKDDLSYKIADTNLRMSDLWWRIDENEKLAQSYSKHLQENLEQTRIAYSVNSALQKSLFRAESVEDAAAMAGHDSGITTNGANKILDSLAEIESIDEMISRQNEELLAANQPVSANTLSNEELLALIHEVGF